jgi:hypothetical protein
MYTVSASSYDDSQLSIVANAIKGAIVEYKNAGGENYGAFSVNVYYDEDDNAYSAECDFADDYNMTIMYYSNSGCVDDVDNLYNLKSDEVIEEMARVIVGENWIN